MHTGRWLELVVNLSLTQISGAALLLTLATPARAVCNLPPLQALGAGNKPSAVAVSPDGHTVYLTAFADDSVTAYEHSGSGCELTFVQRRMNGQPVTGDLAPIQGLSGASAVAVSPDGSDVYVAGKLDHAVAVFHRNGADAGKLTFVTAVIDGVGIPTNILRRPASLAISDDGQNLYAVAEASDTLVVFTRDPAAGTLQYVERFHNGEGVDGLKHPSSVALPRDGLNVYVTGSADGTIAVFSRDPNQAGQLIFQQFITKGVVAGLDGAAAVSVSADGANVYVAGLGANAIVVFRRDLADQGRLTLVETENDTPFTFLREPSVVTVDADGGHVYATSSQDDALLAFVRRTGGAIDVVETRRDGDDGVPSLDQPVGLAVSGDGCVYVASEGDNALMVFRQFEPDTTVCEDWNPCTLADHCDGAGSCTGTCNVGATCPIPCFNVNGTCQLLVGSVCGCGQ